MSSGVVPVSMERGIPKETKLGERGQNEEKTDGGFIDF